MFTLQFLSIVHYPDQCWCITDTLLYSVAWTKLITHIKIYLGIYNKQHQQYDQYQGENKGTTDSSCSLIPVKQNQFRTSCSYKE